MLALGSTIPGIPMAQYAMLLCLTLGIMGIISPYATGPSPVYYGLFERGGNVGQGLFGLAAGIAHTHDFARRIGGGRAGNVDPGATRTARE